MTWTKNISVTLPATGSRTVSMETVGGVQVINYRVIDNSGEAHVARFPLSDVLGAHPEIDAGVLASTLAIFRSYGDTQCGFTDI